MSEIKSVQCANFTATLGETFRFSLVRESGNVGGMIQTGKVQRIHRAARRMAVDLYMPDLKCTHSYFAKEIYLGLFKIARIATGHGKADNWVDLAGYAACAGELEGGGDK